MSWQSQYKELNYELNLPRRINDIPWDFHLLGSTSIQIVQTARQIPLNGWGLPRNRCRSVSRSPASEGAKDILPRHAPWESWGSRPGPTADVTKWARKTKELREYVVSAPGVEPERGPSVRPATGEPARSGRWHVTLQALLAIMVVNRPLLRIAENLQDKEGWAQIHKILWSKSVHFMH